MKKKSELTAWQKRGVCPECGNVSGIFKVVEDVWIRIKAGYTEFGRYEVKCVNCDSRFWWWCPSGKITRKKGEKK